MKIMLLICCCVRRNWETLGKYVGKKFQPKDSIAEAYSVNEAFRFFSMYLHDTNTHFNLGEHDNEGGKQQKASFSMFSQHLTIRPREISKIVW